MKPTKDNILIRIIKQDKTESGIIISQDNSLYQRGEVVAVGKGVLLSNGRWVEGEVKVGDKILFVAPNMVAIPGQEVVLINERDILLIL